MSIHVKKTNILTLRAKKRRKIKTVLVTAYDIWQAQLADQAGVDAILVGDSLSQVMLGNDTTIPLTMDEAVHHTKSVVRGAANTHVVSDMPFLSYNSNIDTTLRNAGRFLKEAGAQSVKLEGGHHICETVTSLVSCGIPVMGHIGLLPQSSNKFKLKGKNLIDKKKILEDAISLSNSGVFAVVIECVVESLARKITSTVPIPTIGIGASKYCDGQILVIDDMLGLSDFFPKFVKI